MSFGLLDNLSLHIASILEKEKKGGNKERKKSSIINAFLPINQAILLSIL
jgi:hypothetical protein